MLLIPSRVSLVFDFERLPWLDLDEMDIVARELDKLDKFLEDVPAIGFILLFSE